MAIGLQQAGKTVAFRVDASIQMGTGHVVRCLTLADELSHHGVRSVFICRSQEGDLRLTIAERGHRLISLPAIGKATEQVAPAVHESWLGVDWRTDAEDTIKALEPLGLVPDWLVVDHYAIDFRWERALRPLVGQIMVIDDLADRTHTCDLLLDQNLCLQMDVRYDDLVPANCVRLLGPRWALLRDEFRQERAKIDERAGSVHSVLVSYGGVDHANLTARTLEALKSLDDLNLSITVVLGATNQHRHNIESICRDRRNVVLYVQTDRMAELMANADLAIGAGGTSTWERAYVGLPSIVVVVAENQREITDAASRCGICWNLGWHESVTVGLIAEKVQEACANPQSMRKMSRQALAVSAREYQTGTSEVVSRMLEGVHVYA